jgi:Ion channel
VSGALGCDLALAMRAKDDRVAVAGPGCLRNFMSPTIPTQTHGIAILIPLAIGIFAFACTTIVHGLAVSATVHFFRHERRLGRAGASFWKDVAIVAAAISILFAAHLVEIALWSVLFLMCGEFSEFAAAFNHSAVNYTTLGYGDVVMTPSWSLLGPLEAANGMLMFGVSTAIIFSVIQRLIHIRFVDLRD